jgi:hypothetical protein
MNEFTGIYPATTLSYYEAFLRAVNPKVPDDFDGPKDRLFTYWEFRAARAKGSTIIPISVGVDGEKQYISMEVAIEDGTILYSKHQPPPLTQTILYESLTFWYRTSEPVPQEEIVFSRLFFISMDGLMGLMPESAKARDHICVFLSGATPVMLRPKLSEDGKRVCRLLMLPRKDRTHFSLRPELERDSHFVPNCSS